jgi:hypothetical protein
MNDQDHSLSLSDPDRSLVLSHFKLWLLDFFILMFVYSEDKHLSE